MEVFYFLRIALLHPSGWRRVWNSILVLLSFQLSRLVGRPVVWGRPVSFSFEPTTACNLRCPECVSGLRAFTRPTGNADISLFERCVDELAPAAFSLLLYFQGEPFLHPDFPKMVGYARKKGLWVETSTNAHFLDDDNAQALVHSGLNRLTVSVDGADQETYAKYRVGGKLERVEAGIRRLAYWKKELGSSWPLIVVQVLAFRQNQEQLGEIRQMALSWGADRVVMKTAQLNDLSSPNPLMPERPELSRYSLGPDGRLRPRWRIRNQCRRLWYTTVFSWDGRVLPCCFDKNAEYEMGRLGSTPFEKIWRGSAYRLHRQRVLSERKAIPMCNNCTEGCSVWVQ